MTMKRRIDVNSDELDQIIDRSTQAPLSESEGQKLKTAIHAMAERLSWKRNTEKTSAVLPPDAPSAGKPESGASAPAGHGRHGAAAFTGADEPETAGPDKYGETAVAMIALLQYGTGGPFKRLERSGRRRKAA